MEISITPEPDEAEREAILAALAKEEEGQPPVSSWADALLPERPEADYEP